MSQANDNLNLDNLEEIDSAACCTTCKGEEIVAVETPAHNGYVTFTYDPLLATGSTLLTNGVLNLMKLSLSASSRIRGVSLLVNTAATTPTVGQNYIGLYGTDGCLIAITNDISSQLLTAGRIDVLFTSCVTVCGDFYVGILSNSTTSASFASIAGGTAGLTSANLASRCMLPRGGVITGPFTTLPTCFNVNAISATTGADFWAGVFN